LPQGGAIRTLLSPGLASLFRLESLSRGLAAADQAAGATPAADLVIPEVVVIPAEVDPALAGVMPVATLRMGRRVGLVG
jgi:hypothetical protein